MKGTKKMLNIKMPKINFGKIKVNTVENFGKLDIDYEEEMKKNDNK